MKFEICRGSIHKDRHVICREDEFYQAVPQEVRCRGPWQVLFRGEVMALRPEYRHALAKDGYCYIETHPVGFSPTDND